MKDVLNALGLEKATLIGNSLGGWMALKFATAYPEYVSRMILIASAGLAEIRPQFLAEAEQARQADGTVQVSPTIIGSMVGEPNIPQEALVLMKLILENYEPIRHLPVYADEELLRLNMPVLFIGGEEDEIIAAKESAHRLSHLLPSAVIHLLPDVGHWVIHAIDYMLPFLK